MKQVWKCDYCYTTDADAEKASAHEKTCSFNPAMKRCWTCAHRTEEGAPISGFWNGCNAGVSSSDQMGIEDNDADCPKWEATLNDLSKPTGAALCDRSGLSDELTRLRRIEAAALRLRMP